MLVGTFGVQGGYLDTTTGIKGQVGDKRFTRVVGIGRDAAGNLYVLNNPWGGGWDLAATAPPTFTRTTSRHTCDGSSSPSTSRGRRPGPGARTARTSMAAPTSTPAPRRNLRREHRRSGLSYPSDPRLQHERTQRDEHFGQLVNGRRATGFPVASGQNPHLLTSSLQRGERLHAIPTDRSMVPVLQHEPAGRRRLLHPDEQGRRVGRLDRTNHIHHYSR